MALDGPIDAGTLPAVLVGPVIRKLTRTHISIWILSRKPDDIVLSVQRQDGSGPTNTATATPMKIGSHLHVAVISAEGVDNGQFLADQLYQYWLDSPGWSGGSAPNWSDFALDSVSFPVGSQPRPTFPGLPATQADFSVLHSSCRRPHANRRDGLAHALALLNEATRPHLLVLSGDQIYADDVASPLMPRIRRIDMDLVGIDESDVFGASLPAIAGRQVKTDEFGLTGDASKDHLWTLGEYFAHYLLSWSEALWPAVLPDLANADPGEVQLADNPQLNEQIWQEENDNLAIFRSTLPAVRTVLANVPVLMMFDDHEVTDDWNLNYRWARDVYQTAGGRRIVANAVLAYVLFQHWGNNPETFQSTGSEEQLALQAAAWTGSSPQTDTMLQRLGLPVAGAIPDPLPDVGFDMRDLSSGNGVRYDFRLGPADGYPLHLVFLDERTTRRFGEDDKPAGRISEQALDVMWPPPVGNAAQTPTLLIAPAPVLGMHAVEHVLQPLLSLHAGGDAEFDFESWTAWRPTFEHLLSRVGQWQRVIALSGDVHFGYTKSIAYSKPEAATPATMVQFVASAAKYAINLTLMLHLLGDALTKLGVVRTRSYHGFESLTDAQRDTLESPPPAGSALPYDDLVDVLLGRVLRQGHDTPAVLSAEVADSYGLGTPDWLYTIEHIDDETPPPAGNLFDAMNSVTGAGFPWAGWDRAKSIAMVRALRASDLHRIGRVFVGLPQLARISFPSMAPLRTRQELFVSIGESASEGIANTVTELELP